MTSLWDRMQHDHDRIWELLNALTGGATRPEGDPTELRETARDLVALFSVHEATEEMVIWPEVRQRCPDGEALLATVLDQEGQAKRAVNELLHIASGSPEFEDCVQTIAGLARTHISYEQSQIWPRLADVLSGADVDALAHRWDAERRRAPSRPHPHTPANPALLATFGRLHAKLDRTRDAAALRRLGELA
jgi:hemerythrin superfamily protein